MTNVVSDLIQNSTNWKVVARFQDRYREKPNGIVEKFDVRQFVHEATKPSILVPDAIVPDPTNDYMICPRCKSPGPMLEHGDLAICKCGLRIELYGLSLKIWLPYSK